MNQKSKLNRIYLPLLLAVILISVAFRCAAVLIDFDPRTGYFDNKTLINIASITVVCGSILLFTYAFVSAKKEKLIATFTTPSTYVPSGAIVTALIFFAVKTYGKIKDYDFSTDGSLGFKNAISRIAAILPTFVEAALVPLALLSAVYFILNATVENRASVPRAAFGLSAVIFSALYATFLYFDKTLAINAPNKIVDQMAFVFAALFFLYEIRISLGRECWHLYISFGFIAAALSAYSSIPSIILYFSDREVISHSIQENVLLLCIFIFVLSRVILAGKLNPDKESDFVIAMRENARARNEYITAKEEVERQAYLELYNRLKEIEELSEDVNENELFGIEKDSDTASAEEAFTEEAFTEEAKSSVIESEISETAEDESDEKETLADGSEIREAVADERETAEPTEPKDETPAPDGENSEKVVEIKENSEEIPEISEVFKSDTKEFTTSEEPDISTDSSVEEDTASDSNTEGGDEKSDSEDDAGA